MKRLIIATIILLTAAISGPALAGEVTVGTLTLQNAWARASIGAAKAGAIYLTIVNTGEDTDRLLSVSTSAAKMSHIHTNIMKNGVMSMRPVKVLEIVPGEPVILQPGGLHVMLMGLKTPLMEGESFMLELTFEKAGQVEVPVQVETPNAMKPTSDSSVPGDHVQVS